MNHAYDGDVASRTLKSVLGQFPKIDIISLKHRQDRRSRVKRQLENFGVSMAEFGVRFFDACQFDDADGFPNKGVRGCFNSHLTLLRRCAHAGKPALIMEDDVFFQRDALAAAAAVPAKLKTFAWDIVYFGSNTPVAPTSSGFVHYTTTIDGSHCRAIRPHIAARLARYMEERLGRPHGDPEGGKGHMDAAINDFRRLNPGVKTYVVTPHIALQFASRTDLGCERWWDRVQVMRPAIELARQMKSGI